MSTIEIKEISKVYGKQKALDRINLSINKGEVVGLLGPNGAGKSTLMKILTSFIPPTSGTSLINGIDVQDDSVKTRSYIGYLPENMAFDHDEMIKWGIEKLEQRWGKPHPTEQNGRNEQ